MASVRTLILAAAGLAALSGCHLIIGLDEGQPADGGHAPSGGNGGTGANGGDPTGGGASNPDGGGGADGGGGSVSEGGGGGVITGECQDSEACQEIAPECFLGECTIIDNVGECSFTAFGEGSVCEHAGGSDGVCTADAQCVECIDEGQCDAGEFCDPNNTCRPVSCRNDVTDGLETDVDCGGDVCPPCPFMDTCMDDFDCFGICTASICSPCQTNADCAPKSQFCDPVSRHCLDPLADGNPCADDGQCESGVCASGICCDMACASDCQSCRGADTGSIDGVCANVTFGLDPKNACGNDPCEADGCSGNSSRCGIDAAGTTCSNATCVSTPPVFTFQEGGQCDSSGICTPGMTETCESGCTAAAGCLPNCAVGSAPIVISEIYTGGDASGTYRFDYVVLHNRRTTAFTLSGWTLQYQPPGVNNWSVITLGGTIAAGSYYLVQLGQGNGGGQPLPLAPDAQSMIQLLSGQGKLLLRSNLTAVTGDCPIAVFGGIVDFVGWGTGTNCSEGALAPSPSVTQSISRTLNECQDTDNNSTNFVITAPSPSNTSSTANVCCP